MKEDQVNEAGVCSFRTIFGTFQGHRIYASRKVAEKIEIQTNYVAELYNTSGRINGIWSRKNLPLRNAGRLRDS